MSNEVLTAPSHVIVTSTKNVGIALLLTFFFGPLGLLYASIRGALILMIGVPVLIGAFIVLGLAVGSSNPTAGFGVLGLGLMMAVATIPVSMVWSVVATNAYNRALVSGIRVGS